MATDDADDLSAAGEHGPEIVLQYWHVTCVVCRNQKSAATSHCKSRMCPWCRDCKKPE